MKLWTSSSDLVGTIAINPSAVLGMRKSPREKNPVSSEGGKKWAVCWEVKTGLRSRYWNGARGCFFSPWYWLGWSLGFEWGMASCGFWCALCWTPRWLLSWGFSGFGVLVFLLGSSWWFPSRVNWWRWIEIGYFDRYRWFFRGILLQLIYSNFRFTSFTIQFKVSLYSSPTNLLLPF